MGSDPEGQTYALETKIDTFKGSYNPQGLETRYAFISRSRGYGWGQSWGAERQRGRDFRIFNLRFIGRQPSQGQNGRIIAKPGTIPGWSQLSECSPDLHPQHQGGVSLYAPPRHCAQCQRLDWHLQGIPGPPFGSALRAMGCLE